MSRSPIQVPDVLKEQLEILKANMQCSSIPNVIKKLINNDIAAKEFEREVRQKAIDEAIQKKAEFVFLGEERKSRVSELKDLLGLESDAITIDFLLDVFYMSDKIERSIFVQWMNRCR